MNQLFPNHMLSVLASLATLTQDPVGGWTGPFWSQEAQGSFEFEIEFADFNGDSYPDIVVPQLQDDRLATVLDGLTGDELYSTPARMGTIESRVEVGDVDGDGSPDLVVSNNEYSHSSVNFGGRIAAIQGGSGQLIWQLRGSASGERIGLELHLRDMDRNGSLDLVAESETGLLGIDPQSGQLRWHRQGFPFMRLHSGQDLNRDGVEELLLVGDQVALLDPVLGVTHWSFRSPSTFDERALVACSDLDGDGWDDLVLKGEQAQGLATCLALSGRTGALLWRVHGTVPSHFILTESDWIGDCTGDGIPDVVVRRTIREMALINGATGEMEWKRTFQGDWTEGPRAVLDRDGDGVHEILMQEELIWSRRSISLLHGPSGSTLWTNADLGSAARLQIHDFEGDGREELLVIAEDHASHAVRAAGWVARLDMATGVPIWAVAGEEPKELLGSWHHAFPDFDGDGQAEMVLFGKGGASGLRGCTVDPQTGIRSGWREIDMEGRFLDRVDTISLGPAAEEVLLLGFNHVTGPHLLKAVDETGDVMWRAEARALLFLGHIDLPDQDGDGVRELLVDTFDGNRMLSVISGGSGEWQPGLRASQASLSVSSGGVIPCDMRFPSTQAGSPYQALFSFAGTGPTQLGGLMVPLGADRWLLESSLGIYPPRYFKNPSGVLDRYGRGGFRLTAAPGRLSPLLIGRTMHCAAVVGPIAGQWEFSSAAVAVEFRP